MTEINLRQIAAETKHLKKVHVIYFSASYCAFCKQLTEDVLNAVRVNKDYQRTVTLTEIQIDGTESIIDFNNKTIDPEIFSEQYNIQITPTLVFIDDSGREIVKRTVGYQNNEFYWYYLDKKLLKANNKLYK